MRIIVSYDESTGIKEWNFFEASFRDHAEWIKEWLDDDEELEIEFDTE